MENTVPSGRGEFKPVETPPAAIEAGSPRLKSWEEVTFRLRPYFAHFLSYMKTGKMITGWKTMNQNAGKIKHPAMNMKSFGVGCDPTVAPLGWW